jgi:hypothetical protein
MKKVTLKFEQTNKVIISKATKEANAIYTFELTSFNTNELQFNNKIDNLSIVETFCTKIFETIDTFAQSKRKMYINGKAFNFNKSFDLYACIDGVDFCLDNASNILNFDKSTFKIANTRIKDGEVLYNKSRRIFAIMLFQLLQSTENKSQLINTKNMAKIDNVILSNQLLLS